MSEKQTSELVDRRSLLKGLTVASAASLAGCSGEEGEEEEGTTPESDPDQELGERVPEPIEVIYWADMGANTAIQESAAPVIKENLEDAFGIEVELRPVDFATATTMSNQDQREHHIGTVGRSNAPDRLDPFELTRRYMPHLAGANGRANSPNYASCEYAEKVFEMQDAEDDEEYREKVYEAREILSNDIFVVNLFPTVLMGAYNPDSISPAGVGEAGLIRTNPNWTFKSEMHTDSIGVQVVPQDIININYMTSQSSNTLFIWSNLLHSPITAYTEDFELVNVLASDWEMAQGGKYFDVELRDDITFHNGDQITSEDVEFTYSHIWSNTGAFPQASAPTDWEINIISDQELEFEFGEDFEPLVTREFPRWGILHKDSWISGGAQDDPEGYNPDELIGSGPFELDDFVPRELARLEPFENHSVFDVENVLTLEAFRDTTTAVEAFLGGEVDVLTEIGPNNIERIETEADWAETVTVTGFMPHFMRPQHSFAPGSLWGFRAAVGAALDRELMNEVAMGGRSEPELYSSMFQPGHPFRPPEDEYLYQFTDDPSGDIEGAQEILKDQGWGWDENGDLRYPADADLSPRWPEGSQPTEHPEDFPCVEELCRRFDC